MKKLLSLFICASFLLIFLFSCAGEENTSSEEAGSKTEPASESVSVTESEEESSEDTPLTNPDIYKGSDYTGRTFTVFTNNNIVDFVSEIVYNDGISEDILPETVNNAIKTRNEKVMDALGVEVKEVYFCSDWRVGGNSLSTIREILSSGINEYDCLSIGLYDCGTLTMENSFYDLLSLENLNLSNPWWEQYFNESVKIGGKVYFTIGDIGFDNKGYTPCVFYNTRLIDELNLEDPVGLAKNGKWTIDKANEYAKAYVLDNADPTGIDYKDNFGWAGQYDDIYSMLYGSGSRILSPGPDGLPVMSLNTETTVNTLEKIVSFMLDDCYICANDYFSITSNPLGLLEEAFESGRCLFYSSAISTAVALDMDDVFGILPTPKYTEDQENYFSLINTWCTNALCIGTNLSEEEAEFSAAVLDVMGYYSWMEYPDSLAFNYYQKMLKNQKLSLEDSEAILDLIFEARGCEVGSIYRIGAIEGNLVVNDMLIKLVQQKQPTGFKSLYDTYGDMFENDVRVLTEALG